MRHVILGIISLFLLACVSSNQLKAQSVSVRQTQNVILITMDGLRWQELFGGADRRLMNKDAGDVRNVEALERRYWRESAEERRGVLMPFFWAVIAQKGQVLGDPDRNSFVRVTNGLFFSYPGYNELLTGKPDPRVDSNAKKLNANVTVLEWLHRKPDYMGRIAAICSWDVFPFIINDQRSGIPVNAGWQDLWPTIDHAPVINEIAADLPRVWDSVRYDIITFQGAMSYLKKQKPRVLYVALGETDDWAHEGRYDLYLDAAHRNDKYIGQLWQAAQSIDQYAGKTSLVLTTDHGRGDTREGWKSHGKSIPGSDRMWIAVMGPDTAAKGLIRETNATQSQVAASVAHLLGEDFTSLQPEISPPLPGIVD